MLRLFSSLLLLLTLCSSLSAQSKVKQKLQIGPTLGLNGANTSIGRVVMSANNRYSYNLGAKAKYPLGMRLMLNGSLIYTQKGSVNKYDGWQEEYGYLDLPVLLSYDLGRNGTRFYPMIGIQQGYLLSARVTDPIVLGVPTSSEAESYRYELGFSVGAGSQFRISSNASVFLDFRYTSGLTNIWKTGIGIFSQRDSIFPEYYNTVLSLNTGILF